VGWWGPVDHHLGHLAALLGRHDEAERRLRNALRIEQRMGAHPFEARTLAGLASVVRVTNPVDAPRLAADAIAVAKAVGADGIITEVDAILAATS
jgi:hypothetical protein